MPRQELTEKDLKIIEDLRYTKGEYKKAKLIAEKQGVDPAEILDMSIRVGLNHFKKFNYTVKE
jgi:hypothetical protein